MAERVPTTKIEQSANETQNYLDTIKSHHDAAEAAAERAEQLEAAGDERGARRASEEADAENTKANEVADVVQAKIGPNHTVNGDGTITMNKVSGDKFDDASFTRQKTVAEASGLTAEQVVMAGDDAADEAVEVANENKAERAEEAEEAYIDSLLEDASIDPERATDDDIADVLDKAAMDETGVLDLVKASGGDPDAMSPQELEDAAVAAVRKEAYRQDGVLDLVEAQGGDPDEMSPEELEQAVERALEAEERQQSTERDEEEPPMSREPVDTSGEDEVGEPEPDVADDPPQEEGFLWESSSGDKSSPPTEDVENKYDTPDGVEGDGGGKPGAAAGRGSIDGTPGGDQEQPSGSAGVPGAGTATGTTTDVGDGTGSAAGKPTAAAAETGSTGARATNPIEGAGGTADEGGLLEGNEPRSTHDPDDSTGGPNAGLAGIDDRPDPLEGTGFGLDDPSVNRNVDTPHLDGAGGGLGAGFDDPLGAGGMPDGSGFGDSFGRGGGPGDAPGGAEGLLGRLPGDATPGAGGGGSSGPGAGGGFGDQPGGVGGNGKPGENPLDGWNPGQSDTNTGGGGVTAPGAGAGGGGNNEPGSEPTEDISAGGVGGVDPGGTPGGGAPSGDGGDTPSDDPGADNGMVKLGNFWFGDVEGTDSGAALDTYVDESGNVWANGPNGLEVLDSEDSSKIDDHMKEETGHGVNDYAEKAAEEAAAAAAEAAQAEAAAAAAEAEEADDTGNAESEDYAEPPPEESPYADDPILNEYIAQENAAEAGADIDYGDHGSLADESRTVDVRSGQVDYGGAMATPADPADIPVEAAQSGLIDPSPMDEPGYGGGDEGGYDAQGEVEAKLKESQSGGSGSSGETSDSTDSGSDELSEEDFGSGSQAMELTGELAIDGTQAAKSTVEEDDEPAAVPEASEGGDGSPSRGLDDFGSGTPRQAALLEDETEPDVELVSAEPELNDEVSEDALFSPDGADDPFADAFEGHDEFSETPTLTDTIDDGTDNSDDMALDAIDILD